MLQGLLLVATFFFSLVPVNGIKELPEAKKYEVVYPRRLHPLHKRDAKEPDQQENFETELKYEMTVNGKIAVLYLKKSKDLLAPGYTETHYNSTGKKVTTSPQIMDHCYYQGHIINEKVSEASISTCRGLRGYFSQGNERYFIEPLSPTNQDEQKHGLFKHDLDEKTNSSCGMDDMLWAPESWRNMAPPATSVVKSKTWKASEHKKYIEYYLVLDNGEFKKYNQDREEIRKRVFEMANYINMVVRALGPVMHSIQDLCNYYKLCATFLRDSLLGHTGRGSTDKLYKKLGTHVALVGIEIWSDKDKIKITPNASFTLESFSKWRGSVLLRRKRHDIAQLITATELSGMTVGLAFMSTMCSPYYSVGLVQDHSDNVLRVAGTMAHEMGHNFGMFHDSYACKCPSTICVMHRALSFSIPTDFSSCSRVSYDKFFEDKLSDCLFNAPLPADIISTPICGNQLVETGEDCDCGTSKECTNTCCDSKTCKIKVGVQCALGECCEKCQFKKPGTVCRPAKDECDLPEMCDGESGICPKDRFRVNGFPCQNGKGYCLVGLCPTLQEQCTEMWGPGTEVADKSCYRRNEGGSKYGYCRKVDATRIPCKANDAMCGKLFCHGGSDNLPWKGRVVTFLTCKTFDPEDNSQEISMVANGTKCGNKKVCINAECVDIERAYKSTNCSSKCKGHANGLNWVGGQSGVETDKVIPRPQVCDHELQCQCKEGWVPPDCDDSSSVVFHFSIVVGVLFPLAVIFVVLAVVIRYQNTRGKQMKVQRPLSITGTRPHRQKRKPDTVKAVQRQEMSQMKLHAPDLPAEGSEPPASSLIKKPDFPPPSIPMSVSSSSLLHEDTKVLSSTLFKDNPMSTPKGCNLNV